LQEVKSKQGLCSSVSMPAEQACAGSIVLACMFLAIEQAT